MPARLRKRLLGGLLLAFAVQSLLIYTDREGVAGGPLDETALRGRAVWQQNNCQTCHQIYGFGGHLGPDLTNRVPPLGATGLAAILAAAPGQMPPYRLTTTEVTQLYAYLSALSRTGISEAHGSQLLELPWFTFAN